MKIEVANGEIIDKHTILLIKNERISDREKLKDVTNELASLSQALKEVYTLAEDKNALHKLASDLKEVNEKLWEVEDQLRILESQQDFGQDFIEKARSVYFLNDHRAALKKAINKATGSAIVETKSYVDYSGKSQDS